MKKKYSLRKIFGELPVHPNKFKELDPKIKWLSDIEEGNSFCTSCGTLTPNIPNSHHKECVHHKGLDSYPEPEPNPLGNCPDCGSEYLSIDSSRELQISEISCSDCTFTYQKKVPEVVLEKQFKSEYLN